MNWLPVFGKNDDSTRRVGAGRRPRVETLEGRELQSGIIGQHIGSLAIQGAHIGSPTIQGAHIGTAIVGQHIGYGAI
jgi:hypothetical protein